MGGVIPKMVPGPIPQSEEEQKAKGNPGKRGRPKAQEAPQNKAAADWLVSEPVMPSYLSEEAQKHWRELIPLLIAKCLICELDGFILGRMCSAYGRAVLAEKELAKGLTKKVSGGNKQRKVEEKIAKDAWAAYYQDAEKFGLTPQARAKMRLPRLQPGKNDSSQERKPVFEEERD